MASKTYPVRVADGGRLVTMLSPWSSVGRMLTAGEWEELKLWRKCNPAMRLRRGATNAWGSIFLRYHKSSKNGENWGTPEQLNRQILYVRTANRRRGTEAYRAIQNAKRRALRKTSSLVVEKERARRIIFREVINKRKRARHRVRYSSEPDYRTKHLMQCRRAAMKNPAYARSAVVRYRMAIKGAVHPQRSDAAIRAIYRLASVLTRISGIPHEVDHIIPAARGGWHHEENLQVLPASVNRSKNGDPYWQSDTYRDWRDVPRWLWPAQLRAHFEVLQSA